MSKLKIHRGIILAAVLIGLILASVFYPVNAAQNQTLTTEYLFGNGDFEGAHYSNWSKGFANPTNVVHMQFAQDNTTAQAGTSSAELWYARPKKGSSNTSDTGWYSYGFSTPTGYSSASLQFSYKSSSANATAFSWEVLDAAGTVVTSGSVAAPNGSAWKTASSINISGLSANANYTLRLKTVITVATKGQTVYAWFDSVLLNITYTTSAGPTINSLAPTPGMYIQGQTTLMATVTDDFSLKTLKWDYSPTGMNTWVNLSTQNFSTATQTTDTYKYTWDPSALTDGKYDIRVTVSDASNYSANAIATYSVDTHGPTLSNQTPQGSTVIMGSSPISINASDWTGVSTVGWEYWDSKNWVPITSIVNPTSGATYTGNWDTTKLPDGNYSVRTKAVDSSPAGLSTVQTVSYVINNIAPVLNNVTPKTDAVVTGTVPLTADIVQSFDTNPIATVKWELSTDGGTTWKVIGQSTTPTGSNNTYLVNWDAKAVPDGKYLIRITATDGTSRALSSTSIQTYVVDNNNPTLNRVEAVTKNLLKVIYNDPYMNSPSAKDIANYSLFETANPLKTVAVTNANMTANGSIIKLTTADQTPGVSYTLQIKSSAVTSSGVQVGDGGSIIQVVASDNSLSTQRVLSDAVLAAGTTSTSGVTDAAGNPLTGTTFATFNAVAQVKEDPHGGYLTGDPWCAKCHSSHKAASEKLITNVSEAQVCYTCHDASGKSSYNVQGEFALASHHDVPNATQTCSTCHDPHLSTTGSPELVKVRDGNNNLYTSGNGACWACHGKTTHGSTRTNLINLPGVDDHESFYNLTPGQNGHYQGAHANDSNPLLKAPTGANINCSVCHQPHGSQLTKLLNQTINGNSVSANDNTQCFSCHQNSSGKYLGQTVWNDQVFNPHGNTTTGAVYPGGTYGINRLSDQTAKGKCVNCHNVHGTPYGSQLLDQFSVPNNTDTDAITNFALCFKCHTSGGPAKTDMQKFYTQTYQTTDSIYNIAGNQGHFIKSSNRYKDGSGNWLQTGWKIPCSDCHNSHGATGQNRYLLNGDIRAVDNLPVLTDLLNGSVSQTRAFCNQCHFPSDTSGSGHIYRGSTIPLLPSTEPQHVTAPANALECTNCHGNNLIQAAHAPDNNF